MSATQEKAAPRCIICGDETSRPFAAMVEHFRPFDWQDPKYIVGNIRTFGFWSGLLANVTLYFPFLNTLIHWKHRKSRLEIAND